MERLFIVIAAKRAIETNSNEQIETLIYDDTTEKFIMDPENIPQGEMSPSQMYYNYLQEKFAKDSGFVIIRNELNIETSIDVQQILANEAKKKLTNEEFNALKAVIISE
jgi:hypothetical protein